MLFTRQVKMWQLGLIAILSITAAQSSSDNSSTDSPTTENMSETTSKHQKQVLTLACLIPYTNGWPVGQFVAAGINVGIDEIYNRGLLPDYDVKFIWRDSWCQPMRSMKVTVEMWQESSSLHGLIGEGCSHACRQTGHLATVWNLPFVAIRCLSPVLSDVKVYPTFGRVVGIVETTAPVYNAVAAKMGWDHIAVINDENEVYSITAQALVRTMENDGRVVYLRSISSTVANNVVNWKNYEILRNIILELKDLVRAIFIFAYAEDMRSILLIAKEEGLMNGEYAFCGSSFAPTIHKEYEFHPDVGPELYEGMLNRENYVPTGPEWLEFSNKVIDRFSDPTYDGWPRLKKGDDPSLVSIYAGLMHDAVLVWAYAMNKTLEQGYLPDDGFRVAENMNNLSFQGITGVVTLDHFADRIPNYQIEIIQNGSAMKIFEWKAGENYLRKVYKPHSEDDWTGIKWPGNATVPPIGRPLCGWEGEFCYQADNSNSKVVSISVAASIAFVFLVMTVAGVHFFRKMKWKAKLKAAMSVLIPWSDVTVVARVESACTVASGFSGEKTKTLYTKTVIYKNEIVAVKPLEDISIDINTDVLIDLTLMKDIKHENLNQFVGVCLEPGNQCILMMYYPRGSLQDVLLDTTTKLSWDFKISLAMDLTEGMLYLHDSPIGFHGHLTSSNCLVDKRWTCKITDFGLKEIKAQAKQLKKSEDGATRALSLLWTAPELLRSGSPLSGSKKGDVFSFGIIIQEICLQDIPYCSNEPFLEPNEIVKLVKASSTPPYRPNVSIEGDTSQWLMLMDKCWSENPDARPNFHQVKTMLTALNGGESLNLVDSMIKRLENHTNNLEEIVMERTNEVHEEKIKVESLLMELLPRSVAESLKIGKPVEPEFFDECTVFFSDVVGFTRISAAGTPMNVIRMLNEMYTLLDDVSAKHDVYKVATIGDAYYVVSGIPIRNGKQHAAEICKMSLSLLAAADTLHIPHIKDETLKLRIGVHSGPVVAGVTGIKMPRYLLFGDTVDIASKMESSGESMRIQISATTADLVQGSDLFKLELRGSMEVKGLGAINTYWLNLH